MERSKHKTPTLGITEDVSVAPAVVLCWAFRDNLRPPFAASQAEMTC